MQPYMFADFQDASVYQLPTVSISQWCGQLSKSQRHHSPHSFKGWEILCKGEMLQLSSV